MLRKFFAALVLVAFCLLFVNSIVVQINGNFSLACLYGFSSSPYLYLFLLLIDKK